MTEEKLKKLEEIKANALSDISSAGDEGQLYQFKVKHLGRKSTLITILRNLKHSTPIDKKIIGSAANKLKRELEVAFELAKKRLLIHDLTKERLDVTEPGKKVSTGSIHPVSIVRMDIENIFISMGFSVADGPEVELDAFNFTALNFPEDHPARDMQDTFYIKSSEGPKMVLRTHTSPVQIRYMKANKPPFRIIVPGRVFRNEATDSTHEHTLHQFEALMVDDLINVGHFKYVAQQFFSLFFKDKVKIRLRPSFFPFTEPSFEFDITCTVCKGGGCRACKNEGWIEIGGAGMVHQNVFAAAGYPKNRYQGFAWGFGLERLAMMKYKIDDIRLFMSGDLRFLKQFGV